MSRKEVGENVFFQFLQVRGRGGKEVEEEKKDVAGHILDEYSDSEEQVGITKRALTFLSNLKRSNSRNNIYFEAFRDSIDKLVSIPREIGKIHAKKRGDSGKSVDKRIIGIGLDDFAIKVKSSRNEERKTVFNFSFFVKDGEGNFYESEPDKEQMARFASAFSVASNYEERVAELKEQKLREQDHSLDRKDPNDERREGSTSNVTSEVVVEADQVVIKEEVQKKSFVPSERENDSTSNVTSNKVVEEVQVVIEEEVKKKSSAEMSAAASLPNQNSSQLEKKKEMGGSTNEDNHPLYQALKSVGASSRKKDLSFKDDEENKGGQRKPPQSTDEGRIDRAANRVHTRYASAAVTPRKIVGEEKQSNDVAEGKPKPNLGSEYKAPGVAAQGGNISGRKTLVSVAESKKARVNTSSKSGVNDKVEKDKNPFADIVEDGKNRQVSQPSRSGANLGSVQSSGYGFVPNQRGDKKQSNNQSTPKTPAKKTAPGATNLGEVDRVGTSNQASSSKFNEKKGENKTKSETKKYDSKLKPNDKRKEATNPFRKIIGDNRGDEQLYQPSKNSAPQEVNEVMKYDVVGDSKIEDKDNKEVVQSPKSNVPQAVDPVVSDESVGGENSSEVANKPFSFASQEVVQSPKSNEFDDETAKTYDSSVSVSPSVDSIYGINTIPGRSDPNDDNYEKDDLVKHLNFDSPDKTRENDANIGPVDRRPSPIEEDVDDNLENDDSETERYEEDDNDVVEEQGSESSESDNKDESNDYFQTNQGDQNSSSKKEGVTHSPFRENMQPIDLDDVDGELPFPTTPGMKLSFVPRRASLEQSQSGSLWRNVENSEMTKSQKETDIIQEDVNITPRSPEREKNRRSKTPSDSPQKKLSSPYRQSLEGVVNVTPNKSVLGIVPTLIECQGVGIWRDITFVYHYKNEENKTDKQIKELAFENLISILDKAALNLSKDETLSSKGGRYKFRKELNMEDIYNVIQEGWNSGGFKNKAEGLELGSNKEVKYQVVNRVKAKDAWKIKFSQEFQNICKERGFYTFGNCDEDYPLRLAMFPSEVCDILRKNRELSYKPCEYEDVVKTQIDAVEYSPQQQRRLSSQMTPSPVPNRSQNKSKDDNNKDGVNTL